MDGLIFHRKTWGINKWLWSQEKCPESASGQRNWSCKGTATAQESSLKIVSASVLEEAFTMNFILARAEAYPNLSACCLSPNIIQVPQNKWSLMLISLSGFL